MLREAMFLWCVSETASLCTACGMRKPFGMAIEDKARKSLAGWALLFFALGIAACLLFSKNALLISGVAALQLARLLCMTKGLCLPGKLGSEIGQHLLAFFASAVFPAIMGVVLWFYTDDAVLPWIVLAGIPLSDFMQYAKGEKWFTVAELATVLIASLLPLTGSIGALLPGLMLSRATDSQKATGTFLALAAGCAVLLPLELRLLALIALILYGILQRKALYTAYLPIRAYFLRKRLHRK